MVFFYEPDISYDEVNAATSTLLSGWVTKGQRVREFESQIASICHTDHAVCFDSCTAALEMSLRVLGIGPGDEVITTPFTYSATSEVIRNVGATIIFCDLKAGSFEMDYDKMETLINKHTKAVIPVDYGGVPCDYDEIYRVINNKRDMFNAVELHSLQSSLGRIAVVADAAHSFGAEYKGNPVGSVADFTCFSFHAVKPVTSGGEGGAVTWRDFDGIDNDGLKRYFSLLGDHGQTEKGISRTYGREWEYDIELFGYNHIMTDVDASVGIAQLKRLPEIHKKREELAKLYKTWMPDCVEIALDHFMDEQKSSMHIYPIRIPKADERRRDSVFAKMLAQGVRCNVHFKPLPLFTAYRNAGFLISDYPNSYSMYKNLITLPFHTKMNLHDVMTVCSALDKVVTE